MRIIEWNCQGAFRNKFEDVMDLKPDILIVLECESIEKLQFGEIFPKPNSFYWYSDSGKKGVAVFSFCDYKIEVLKVHNPHFRYVIPLFVSNLTNSFFLFAVWAMDHLTDPLSRYIGQVWNALNFYKPLLTQNCIIVGDFNSNKIWDYKDRSGNHTSVVELMQSYEIYSLYHHYFDELQGEEKQSTFFLHRNKMKPYHIDYVFASTELYKDGLEFFLGKSDEWLDKSDHIPLIVDLSFGSVNVEYDGSCYSFVKHVIEGYNEMFQTKFDTECAQLLRMAIVVDEGLNLKADLYEAVEKMNRLDCLFQSLLLKLKP